MGSAFLLLLFVILSFCLYYYSYDLRLDGPRDQKRYGGQESRAFSVEEWEELEVEKVSGEDNVGGVRIPGLEKVRMLLGLLPPPESGSTNAIFVYNSPSPSPAPAPVPAPELVPPPAPALAPVLHPTAMRIRFPSPHPGPSLIPLLKKGQVSGKAKAGRIIMAAMLSTGSAIAIVGLTGLLLLRRSRRRREKKQERTMQVTGASMEAPNGDSGVNSARGPSSRPGLRLFLVNSMEKERATSRSKDRNSLPSSSSSNGESIECRCDLVGANFPAKVGYEEEPASSDEAAGGDCYHSVCNSRGSMASSSDDSEANVGVASEIRSPSGLPERSVSCDSTPQVRKNPERPPPKETARRPSQDRKIAETSLSSNLPQPPPLPLLAQPPPFKPSFKFSKPPPPLPPLPLLLVRSPTPPLQPSPSEGSNSHSQLPSPPPPPPPPPSLPMTRMRTQTRSESSPGPPPLWPPQPPLPSVHLLKVVAGGVPALPKLKPFHWDKVRAAPDQTMVWNKIRSSSFELDEEMIESLFSYNAPISTKTEDTPSSSSKSNYQFKLVLEPQRLRNFTILLKALNANLGQVREALSQGTGLSAQQLEVLAKMVPTKEEEQKLLSYDEDLNELDPAEKFLASILRIPCSFLKVEAMLYAETFDDEVSQIKKSFQMLEAACEELRSSRLFLKLLKAVLQTGNRMNAGTMRGDARAFRLDALLKLAAVKGTDGKTTLLHFIMKEVIRSERADRAHQTEEDYRIAGAELVAELNGELSNVKKTAGFDFRNLAASLSNLTDGMGKLKHLVSAGLPAEDRGGSFVYTMNIFLENCERTVAILKDDERQMLKKVKDTAEYFHGERSKDEIEQLRIFVIVRDFLGMLDQTSKEFGSSKKNQSPTGLPKRVP